MTFAYYHRLTRRQQATYRRSDGLAVVPLAEAGALRPLVMQLANALETHSRPHTQACGEQLLAALTRRLGVAAPRLAVLAQRPHDRWGELHGLYVPTEGRRPAHIAVWMRTARRRQVVAFRTFLRTLLHELGHHLDYTLFGLAESFHTAGFYRRESSLFHQLMPAEDGGDD